MGWYQSGGNQVYLVVPLRHRVTGRTVVVAVTHLKAKGGEKNERTRADQVTELLGRVQCSVAGVWAKVDGGGDRGARSPINNLVPVLIMGDFNSDPGGDGWTCAGDMLGTSGRLEDRGPFLRSA